MGMLKKMKNILTNNRSDSTEGHDAASAHKAYLETVAEDKSLKAKNSVAKPSPNDETILYKPIRRTFVKLSQKGILPNSFCYKYFKGNQYLKILGAVNPSSDQKHCFYALALVPSNSSESDYAYFDCNKQDGTYSYNQTALASIKRYIQKAGVEMNLHKNWYRLFATYSIAIHGKKSLLIDLNPGFRRIQEFDND